MEDIDNKILKLFTYNDRLKFSEIESSLNIRSNKLAYYIKNLIKSNILEKDRESYKLTETAENLIPYFSEKTSPLPIILIRIGDNKKCFLKEREKRPFRGKLSLPGGRLLVNESIEKAVERIMKEKYNIHARLEKINSVSLEFVRKKGKTKHSFLLILVSAKTRQNIALVDIEKNKLKITSSDYKLITSKDREITIKTLQTPL
jgi:ADP-ribose pyrophosphatase YjhB (NUDIX family)